MNVGSVCRYSLRKPIIARQFRNKLSRNGRLSRNSDTVFYRILLLRRVYRSFRLNPPLFYLDKSRKLLSPSFQKRWRSSHQLAAPTCSRHCCYRYSSFMYGGKLRKHRDFSMAFRNQSVFVYLYFNRNKGLSHQPIIHGILMRFCRPFALLNSSTNQK